MSYQNGIYRTPGGATMVFKDGKILQLGTDLDVSIQFDGTKLAAVPLADDTVYEFGNGTLSADRKWFGNIPTAYEELDASLSQLGLFGPMRPRGFNKLPRRLELKWVAGAQGLPQLNAVTDPPAADTYNTAAILALLNADRHFEILGSNASSDDVTISAEGGIKMETDGGGTDSVILLPHLNTGQSPWTSFTWGTDQETSWECHIKTGSAITSQVLWAGLKLTNTSVTATDNDQVFFRFAPGTNSGKWECNYSIGGTDVEADSGVTVAADTEYHLLITIDSSRIPRFYINGALVVTGTALTDATDLKPYIGILESAAAAKHMYVYGQAISRKFA